MRINLNVQIFIFIIASLITLSTKKVSAETDLINQEVAKKTLIKIAIDINKQTPIMMDSETRCDYVLATGLTIAYNYTLVNLDDPKSISKETIEKFKQGIINAQCSDQRVKRSMRSGMKTAYFYKDKNGRYITSFETGIRDCR